MGLMTFKGGVHPFEGKDLSKDKPIRELLPKGELVYPLSQHIGAPATPIVAVGDTVLKGQKIAEAGGFVSAPIHASVSGTVKKIEPRRVPTGDMVNSIVFSIIFLPHAFFYIICNIEIIIFIGFEKGSHLFSFENLMQNSHILCIGNNHICSG